MAQSFKPTPASQQVVEDTAKVMDRTWETIQEKTFTKWVNSKLADRKIEPITDLTQAMSDGVRLIQLLEIIGDYSFGRYNKNPKLRIQKVENVNKALEFIKRRGVPLTNIGAEDIVDASLKLILGMIWTIILRFTIADISQEGLTAKEGLLLWCQRKTAPYAEVDVRDFTYSWQDGLAFCALIHRHRPDLLDYDSLNKTDRHTNTALAFEVAATKLGIPQLLDVEDVCDIQKPDERSIMTYVALYFHAFSHFDKVETAGRRVAKFAEVMQSVWDMEHDFERRVKQLMQNIINRKNVWANSKFDGNYSDAKRHSMEFNQYKSSEKRVWVSEKSDIDTLLGNIQTKLKTYELQPYHPPTGLTLNDLDKAWQSLLEAEAKRYKAINDKIREIKESLRKTFAQSANDFQKSLDSISHSLAELDGNLDAQLVTVKSLLAKLGPLENSLRQMEELDAQCREANVEENDYTVFSIDDLKFELRLVQQSINKKSSFIENQMVARNMTNLTPAQLEEFEGTFRHFDTDSSNTLNPYEFKAALASLGIVYDDAELNAVFDQMCEGQSEASFEQFIRFMVNVTEDKTSPDQLRQSFKIVAGDKPFVTELDLRRSLLPENVLSYLKEAMPERESGYDYSRYLDQVFQE
ncbi:actinin-like protein [Gigaspora margarita]|uniref:Actinin-like protein n=1 Tax=Gigaspora margarita TaxID=4874 RepID=A0A8H4AY60_GIGMA|nr:actinin-like protein [Gigaspora margarita]